LEEAVDLAIDDPDFFGRGLAVRTAGWFRGPRVVIDGDVVKGRWGRFIVRDNRGQSVTVQLKSNHIDPIPKVTIGSREVVLARPLVWYEYVWSGLPIIMAYHGGAIGALCGFAALQRSAAVFRAEGSEAKKFLLTGLISGAAVVAYFILGSIFLALVRKWWPS
jgi:hypothetical protein